MICLSNADPLHSGEAILVNPESVVVIFDDHAYPDARVVKFSSGSYVYVSETVEEIGVLLNGIKTISERS
jgi:hypothetical protein